MLHATVVHEEKRRSSRRSLIVKPITCAHKNVHRWQCSSRKNDKKSRSAHLAPKFTHKKNFHAHHAILESAHSQNFGVYNNFSWWNPCRSPFRSRKREKISSQIVCKRKFFLSLTTSMMTTTRVPFVMLISNASYVPTFLYLATKRVNAPSPHFWCSRAMICFVWCYLMISWLSGNESGLIMMRECSKIL